MDATLKPPPVNLKELEIDAIKRALAMCDGNRTHASRLLGIATRTLQRKLKRWGLQDRLPLGAKPTT